MVFHHASGPQVRPASLQLPTLHDNRLLLFVLLPDHVPEHLLHQYLSWLSPAEQQQWRRFYFPQHQREYLLGHALTRYILSAYTECAPAEVLFAKNQFGKPALASNRLSFNLSHSAGVSVLALVRGGEVGVDIEKLDASRADLNVAQRYFSAAEYQQLQDCDALAFARTFFSFWTLKEAYIKARGLGLSLPLADFSFRFQGDHITLYEQPYLRNANRDWCGELLCLQDDYVYAWTWSGSASAASASYYWIVPQYSCRPLDVRLQATLSYTA